jgi:hypothetical protein
MDAAMAMFIFASALVFAMAAVHQSRRISEAALEIRQARGLTQSLFETYRDAHGVIDGRTDRFAWRVTIDDPVRTSGAATLCRHSVAVTNLRSQRVYGAATDEICASGDQS